tara:strand:- start:808 stop:990 length:183 start_codon:yes stop_codon:yes gene_type:complete
MGIKIMTKKDYIKVANFIKQERDNGNIIIACRPFINSLCNTFKKDNPRFDEKKFIKACGM